MKNIIEVYTFDIIGFNAYLFIFSIYNLFLEIEQFLSKINRLSFFRRSRAKNSNLLSSDSTKV